MSWSSRIFAYASTAAALCAVIWLTGCGFQPLYARGSASSSTELAKVEIARIPDRAGQILRNELRSLMAPRGRKSPPSWRLNVTLNEATRQVLLADTSFATREELTVSASYALIDLNSGAQVGVSATTSASSSYNILSASNEYANVVAERGARDKALHLIARDITNQVAVWLRDAADDAAAGGS